MEVGGVGTSAAKRRRERRLRSWWRHECQSVRMAVTAAAHHSAEKMAASGTNSGLRAQTTVSTWRPDVLEEPEPPLVSERAACPRSLGAPSPSLPQLAAAASDAVDDSALRFLTALAFRLRKEEGDEARRQKMKDEARLEKLEEEFEVLVAIGPERLSSRQDAWLTTVMRERAEISKRMREAAASSSRPAKEKRRRRNKRRRKRTRSRS